jgi:peptidoglycan-associated lipoprotein
MRQSKLRLMALCIMLVLLAAGCKKKPAPVTPPPAPPPAPAPAAKPTATITVSPTSIERGQSTTVEWSSQNADKVSISPEIGSVSTSGSRSVRPQQSTTYRLTATGPGGSVEASARVTVTAPPPPPYNPPSKPAEEDIDAIWARQVKSILFDYDKYDVRDDQRAALQGDADFLKAHPNVNFQIEGNCDERGSEEYNLGLGDRRANALKEALVNLGIPAARIGTISYGKERPKCTDSNEACWQQNRRGDFTRKR